MMDENQIVQFGTLGLLEEKDQDYLECVEEVNKIKKSVTISSPIFLLLTSILLAIVAYLTAHVGHLVWSNDKIVPIMLGCLCASLLSLVWYYSFQIIEVTQLDWTCGVYTNFMCV